MKKKHLLRSIMAIVLCAVMLSGIFAVGYSIYLNEQGKKVVIDKDNNLPVIKPVNGSASANVTTENGKTTNDVTLNSTDGSIVAVIPSGTLLNEGASKVTLTVKEMENSQANVKLEANEEKSSFDIHIEGISSANTSPIKVYIKEMLPVGLNMGNYKLYHVENGVTNEMTLLNGEPVHNSFTYDPVTGDVNLYLASFSEVAVVADTENAWNGDVEPFAAGSGTEADPYIIANADQLAYFGKLVGGMGYSRDSFKGKFVKLVTDINLGDKNNANENLIFYPIGYYYNGNDSAPESTVYSFEGTFNGNGHTISNFYQNTWEIKGDYDANYYSDAMGLFGYVVNGKIENLTVDNFSSDGEFTPTGVIAAYAVNSAFENIAITNCNPRVYNTGNGGIVGIGGVSSDTTDNKLTFTNITVDNSNKISALWGSWDVACGGLMGMFRGNGLVEFTNCHMAAQIDVFNDVCGNYQYYWYRYAGMMIGSIRGKNTTDGSYTVPNISGISATNCTVDFGDWNNYYYCELVANTLASYTHDHQFSRLEQIASLDEIKSGDTWTRTGNFLLINGDTKTCYHIVSKNGVLTEHKHADAGTEVVNGETVLKENNQIIFLPFHQLIQGDGWGVKHVAVNDFKGITTLYGESSVEKFETNLTDSSLMTNKEYKVSEIFKALADADVYSSGVWITITKLNENETVVGEFTKDIENWENGTISFTGTGSVEIKIQDYNYCKPTTITVTLKDKEPEVKFENKFTGDFLYRVGSQNAVTLDSLFSTKDGVSIGTVDVKFETISGTASGVYTSNATWTNGSIKFSGTGVVKVTITDNDYCTPTEVTLEVVDATNLTKATGTTAGGTFVLLCDVNTSTYVNYWNCTLYGNGFTYSLNGAPTSYNSKQGHGVLITKNATLDNLVIKGDIYDEYGAFTNNEYYNAAIDVVEHTTIKNCYISGCSAPISTRASATIVNTTLYGGAVANLIIKGGTVTLENVTTANYDDGRSLVGMGIVIHSDATESAKLVLNGTLTQYNFINESKAPSDSYASNLHNAMFSSSCSQYHFGTGSSRYVNTGIISLTSIFNEEDITDNANTGYVGSKVSASGFDGFVYTQPNTTGSVNNNYIFGNDTHIGANHGAVPPSYSFDYSGKNYVAKVEGSNDYCYFENGSVRISMDDGESFSWDTSILTVGKTGQALTYTVAMNGVDYTGKSIVFNTADDYVVLYTYADPNNYKLDENGNLITYSVTYTQSVNISVSVIKATTKHAEFTFGPSNTASTTVIADNKNYVMPNVNGTSSTIGSTTVGGKTVYYPIVEIIMSDGKTSHTSGWYAYFPVFENVVTIYDYANGGTGSKETLNTSTMPTNLAVVGDPTELFKYQSGSKADSAPAVKSSVLVYSSAKIEAKRSEYSTVVQYCYTDNAGTPYYYYVGYHAPAQSYSNTCVTPDTLITLADGTQVRVDSLTGNENLLVWNHETGKLDIAPIAYIVDHDKVAQNREIIHLYFSNGSEVKIMGEHVFYDATLNKYIAIDSNNAEEFIGHKFLGLGDSSLSEVELVAVERTVEETEVYEVVSYKHLTCFTNGILSTSAYLDKLLNVFDINTETYAYNAEAVQKDIEAYGLYTYADFKGLISEEAFELYNAKYLKIAVEKGYITWDDILDLIDIYFNVNVQPIQ